MQKALRSGACNITVPALTALKYVSGCTTLKYVSGCQGVEYQAIDLCAGEGTGAKSAQRSAIRSSANTRAADAYTPAGGGRKHPAQGRWRQLMRAHSRKTPDAFFEN